MRVIAKDPIMKDDGFLEFVIDQLSRLPGVRHRRMFGGVGLYSGDHFFAVIDEGRLYLKVDEVTVGDFEARGMKAFAPTPDMILKTYYEVPVDVLEDDAELCRWAQRAVEAQIRTRARKAGKGTARRGRRGGKGN